MPRDSILGKERFQTITTDNQKWWSFPTERAFDAVVEDQHWLKERKTGIYCVTS
jgi:hypothetical protein